MFNKSGIDKLFNNSDQTVSLILLLLILLFLLNIFNLLMLGDSGAYLLGFF